MSAFAAAAAASSEASSVAQAALLEAAAAEATAAATASITGASAATVVARVAGQIFQGRIDFLISFSEYVDQRLGLLGIVLGEEGERGALCVGSSCATDAMDVVLAVLRVVKVDDILDAVHVFLVL